jgi:hypothetical protein
MGSFKKEAARRDRQGKTSDGMANVKVKGENFYRSAKKAKQLSIRKLRPMHYLFWFWLASAFLSTAEPLGVEAID